MSAFAETGHRSDVSRCHLLDPVRLIGGKHCRDAQLDRIRELRGLRWIIRRGDVEDHRRRHPSRVFGRSQEGENPKGNPLWMKRVTGG
jgi:hypothetical protein